MLRVKRVFLSFLCTIIALYSFAFLQERVNAEDISNIDSVEEGNNGEDNEQIANDDNSDTSTKKNSDDEQNNLEDESESNDLNNLTDKNEVNSNINDNTNETIEVQNNSDVTNDREEVEPVVANGLEYNAFVQTDGWQASATDGEVAGTIGESKRLEALKIQLTGNEYTGGISYSAHVSNYGWKPFVKDNEIAGTVGNNLSIEAIKIQLTGDIAQFYDVYYSVYSQTYGQLGWAKNGEIAGSVGCSKRSEAIIIKLIKKGEEAPSTNVASYRFPSSWLKYQAHSQNIGWQNIRNIGSTAGTTGKKYRLEAFKIKNNSSYSGNVVYQSYVSGYGWQKSVSNNKVSGTTGKSKSIQAIKVELTGTVSKYFDIYYRVYVSNKGWLGWAKNNQTAGSTGLNASCEAIQIKLIEKNKQSNLSENNYYYTKKNVEYKSCVETYGWQNTISNGGVSGTTGKGKSINTIKASLPSGLSGSINYKVMVKGDIWSEEVSDGTPCGKDNKRIEAIKFTLSGDVATQYDIYYRAHCQNIGWLGWTKNGSYAGTQGYGYRLEAYQIVLIPKGFTHSTGPAFKKQVIKKKYQPPYYSQKDSRWANTKYGGYTMSDTGCVPTSIAMALTGILTKVILPTTVASYLYNKTNQFNKTVIGCCGLGMKYAANYFGVKSYGISSLAQMNDALNKGYIVIGSVGPGHFAGPGRTHCILLYSYKTGGYTYVNDSNNGNNVHWWATGTIWTERSRDPIDLNGGYCFYAYYL